MFDVTHILSAIEAGDPQAAEQLLPLLYDDLRKLAAKKLVREAPGRTLQATALVHEAYLRPVGPTSSSRDSTDEQHWDGRRHFFAAAAEAMRRILINRARDRGRLERGPGWRRLASDMACVAARSILPRRASPEVRSSRNNRNIRQNGNGTNDR
jgi:RNA polymerase sigma factor (TIGR02999 family)